MDIWQTEKLILFLAFFIPGFISLKVFGLLVPSKPRDFSKSILEVIGYSSLNYAALSWLVILIHSGDFYTQYKILYLILLLMIIFVIPVFWPILLIFKLSTWPPIAKYIVHFTPKPWDYLFNKREKFWIIIHLKDERKIGGVFDTNSFASSYPAEEQIYLETVWRLDENGTFIEPVERSKGILISNKEILAIELFE